MPDERREIRRHEDRERHRLHWLRLAAWVGVIAVVMWGFHLSQVATSKVEHEAKARAAIAATLASEAKERAAAVERESLDRAYTQCVNSNEARSGIVEFVTDIVRKDHPVGPLNPREQAIIALAKQRFHMLTCPPEPTRGPR